jgi:hypothetical protein
MWSQIRKEAGGGGPVADLQRGRGPAIGHGYARSAREKAKSVRGFADWGSRECRPLPRRTRGASAPLVDPPQGKCPGGKGVKKKKGRPIPFNVEFCQTRHAAVPLNERLAGQVCELILLLVVFLLYVFCLRRELGLEVAGDGQETRWQSDTIFSHGHNHRGLNLDRAAARWDHSQLF